MNQTTAESLAQDPRIAQAKTLILDTVKDYQKQIQTIRSASNALKENYDTLIADYEKQRGQKLWFPYIGSGFGNGALVELLDGSIKYDFIGGIGVHLWGHSHPDIIASEIDAAMSDVVMSGNLQPNKDSIDLSTLLTKVSGKDHCFFSTSGVMANENALKIAFQKNHPAHRLLAFEGCFAGRTWAVAQITDKPAYRDGLPSNVFVDYIPFFDAERPEESTQEAITILKQHLHRHPKEYAAMIFELVQGERGAYPGNKTFFQAIMELLKEHHVCCIIDEVQTFGRTSQLFAFQHFELEEYADIITIGKVAQVCATLYSDAYNPRVGLLAQTFTSSTAAFYASKVIIESLLNEGFYGPEGKIEQIHNSFTSRLHELSQRHPKLIQGPFGIGAMIAFTPFDGEPKRVVKFIHDLFHAGVISFVAGSHPARARFLVPVGAITEEQIDHVMKIVEETLLKG